MARKTTLSQERRAGQQYLPGIADSLIAKFTNMIKRGELKPSVGHLIKLMQFREKVSPGKVTVRWVEKDRSRRRY